MERGVFQVKGQPPPPFRLISFRDTHADNDTASDTLVFLAGLSKAAILPFFGGDTAALSHGPGVRALCAAWFSVSPCCLIRTCRKRVGPEPG